MKRIAIPTRRAGDWAPLLAQPSLHWKQGASAMSALLFAEETHTRFAVLIVHSFSRPGAWFDDFSAFAQLLGADAEKEKVVRSTALTAVPLFVGWITGDPRFATMNVPATNCP